VLPPGQAFNGWLTRYTAATVTKTETLLDATRALAPAVAAAADEIDREVRLPASLVKSLVQAGLFRMIVPRSLGGVELDLQTFSEVIETVATADASVAWCLAQNAGISPWAAQLRPDSARELYRPDSIFAGGYGPAGAVALDGGYRLTGRWTYASGIRHSNWLRGTCELVDVQGRPILDERGAKQHLVLFFPTSDAEIIDVWQVSGLRGTGSDTYTVHDLFVPAERCADQAVKEAGPLYVFGTNQVFSLGFASVALGLARAILDALLELAGKKTPRGVSGLLRDQPRVQMPVALSEAKLRSARAFLKDTVAAAWDDVCRTGRLSMEHRVNFRLATTFTIQQCAAVVDSCYHLAGGTAIFTNAPFERRFRDVNAVTQQVQSRSDHFEVVGRYLMGLEPDWQWL
jgi:alkylation response protein AidB-like acyl-CoA dehydrogenase